MSASPTGRLPQWSLALQVHLREAYFNAEPLTPPSGGASLHQGFKAVYEALRAAQRVLADDLPVCTHELSPELCPACRELPR